MLIEVKCFRMITAEDQTWRERLMITAEESTVSFEIASTFPDCPTCAAPPQPRRCDISRRVEIFERIGVQLVTWDITCRCSTRLRYEGYEGGPPPALVSAIPEPPF